MTSSILLSLALSLLIAAQGPGVPQSLKNEAVNVANSAIMIAMEEVKNTPEKQEKPLETESVKEVADTPRRISVVEMQKRPEYIDGKEVQVIKNCAYRLKGGVFVREACGG